MPAHVALHLCRKRAAIRTYPHGPKPPELLEMQRGMPRIPVSAEQNSYQRDPVFVSGAFDRQTGMNRVRNAASSRNRADGNRGTSARPIDFASLRGPVATRFARLPGHGDVEARNVEASTGFLPPRGEAPGGGECGSGLARVAHTGRHFLKKYQMACKPGSVLHC